MRSTATGAGRGLRDTLRCQCKAVGPMVLGDSFLSGRSGLGWAQRRGSRGALGSSPAPKSRSR